MLKSIKFTDKWRCFEKGFSVMFRDGVNLLVGDQGTGKSSLYQALVVHGIQKPRGIKLPRKADVPLEFTRKGEPRPILAFDFEHDNFRTKTWFDDSMTFHVVSMFSNHGETVKALMGQWSEVDKPAFVLVDEPDMALSIRLCYRLADSFKHVATQGGQVVATAHNPIVIGEFAEVYSLEHRKWMSGSEFIETQKQET